MLREQKFAKNYLLLLRKTEEDMTRTLILLAFKAEMSPWLV